jgi:hypothetical protein
VAYSAALGCVRTDGETNVKIVEIVGEGSILYKRTDRQYSETNVMHFLFSLLRINDLYMFRALLAHP